MKSRMSRVLAVVMSGLFAAPAMLVAVPPTTPHPAPKVNPLAAQQKAVIDARIKLDQAKQAMLVIRRRVEATFETKPEWKSAKDGVERSKSDFDAAMRKIIAKLEKLPAYKAEVDKRDKAQVVIDSALKPQVATSDDAPKTVSDEEIKAAARTRSEAVLKMKSMEREAQEADPNYPVLKQKSADAQAAWAVMEAQVDANVKLDAAYPMAQKDLEAAEATYKQAHDALMNAQKTAHPAVTPTPRPRPAR